MWETILSTAEDKLRKMASSSPLRSAPPTRSAAVDEAIEDDAAVAAPEGLVDVDVIREVAVKGDDSNSNEVNIAALHWTSACRKLGTDVSINTWNRMEEKRVIYGIEKRG